MKGRRLSKLSLIKKRIMRYRRVDNMNTVIGTCIVCVVLVVVLWGIVWGISKLLSRISDRILPDDDK